MKKPSPITSKYLKVHTGEVLQGVAEGDVVYVTHRDKLVARIESTVERRTPAETRTLDTLIDEMHGALSDSLPTSASFSRAKTAEERRRDRR